MLKKAIILGALFVCLFVLWFCMESKHSAAVRPPANATNFIGFLQFQPQPAKIRKFAHAEKTYVEVLGDAHTSLLSLPSGPPAYIFDETGLLVDWTADRGDAPTFVNKWGSFSNANFISVEEAKQLLK